MISGTKLTLNATPQALTPPADLARPRLIIAKVHNAASTPVFVRLLNGSDVLSNDKIGVGFDSHLAYDLKEGSASFTVEASTVDDGTGDPDADVDFTPRWE